MHTFDLKKFRDDKKITQVELAELFSCNQNFISRIEKGIRQIPPDKLDILQLKYGDISSYYKEEKDGVTLPDTTPQDLMFAGADAFSRQIVQMMNEKLIAPYSLLVEKDKEIARLNKEIGKLEAQLEASKKMTAQEGSAAKCADAV
jgi:predicted transcriptional regulator